MSDLPRIGSALIVRDEADRVLLGKRNKDPQRGSWVLPGGKIRAFETIAEAAARELEEETGLKIEVTGQFRVYEIVNPPTEQRIVIYSWGKVIGGTIRAADDISEVRFVPRRELGELQLTPLVRQALRDADYIADEPRKLEELAVETKPALLPVAVEGLAARPSHRAKPAAHRKRHRAVDARQSAFTFEGG